MRYPVRLFVFVTAGLFAAGSTTLSYYYYYVYSPPLEAAERFLEAMEASDPSAIQDAVRVSVGMDADALRPPTLEEIEDLLAQPFERGRVLDQRKREGRTRCFHYLVYREPDGRIYALVVTEDEERLRVLLPESPMNDRGWYLWDYAWTN